MPVALLILYIASKSDNPGTKIFEYFELYEYNHVKIKEYNASLNANSSGTYYVYMHTCMLFVNT